MTDITREQPAPIKADEGDAWATVIKYTETVYPADAPVTPAVLADMRARREVGIERYGTALQPDNGRDSLVDAYQEQLDFVVYLVNWLMAKGVDMDTVIAAFAGDELDNTTINRALKTHGRAQVFALFVDSVARLALVRELIEAEHQGAGL